MEIRHSFEQALSQREFFRVALVGDEPPIVRRFPSLSHSRVYSSPFLAVRRTGGDAHPPYE
jgi:hypothetical protein